MNKCAKCSSPVRDEPPIEVSARFWPENREGPERNRYVFHMECWNDVVGKWGFPV